MGSLMDMDEFQLDLFFDKGSPLVTAGNAADAGDETDESGDVNDSNDHRPSLIDDAPTFKTYSQAHAPTACSNDNPHWSNGTMPCPNATVTGSGGGFGGVFDGITPTPTSIPPDVVVPNEFATSPPNKKPSTPGAPAVTSNDMGVLDGIGGTPSPTKKPSAASPNEPSQTSNDIGSILATPSPSKKPSTSPSKQPAGTFSTSDVNNADNADNVYEASGWYPKFYSCGASSREELVEGGGVDELPLRFDYEIYTATSVDDVPAVLATFERQLTDGVAASLGLADCPESEVGTAAVEFARNGKRMTLPWGRRRTLQREPPSGGRDRSLQTSNVLGLSGDPVDEIDTDLADCTSSQTLDVPSKCSPIIGAMTAWVTSARRRRLRQLQEEVQFNPVESYINDNQAEYLNDELLHVVYIGQRSPTTTPEPVVDGVEKVVEIGGGADDSALNPLLIGLATGGVLLVLLLMGAAWVARRRQRREAEEEMDAEQGAFPGLTPESESNPNHYGTGGGDDEATQVSAPPLPENVRSDNLFRLDVPSDAHSLQSRELASSAALGSGEVASPSTPSDLGMASPTSRRLDFSGEDGAGSEPQDMTPDSQLFLANAPTIVEAEDDESDAFGALSDEDGAGGTDPEVSGNTTLSSREDDGVMV